MCRKWWKGVTRKEQGNGYERGEACEMSFSRWMGKELHQQLSYLIGRAAGIVGQDSFSFSLQVIYAMWYSYKQCCSNCIFRHSTGEMLTWLLCYSMITLSFCFLLYLLFIRHKKGWWIILREWKWKKWK